MLLGKSLMKNYFGIKSKKERGQVNSDKNEFHKLNLEVRARRMPTL